MTDAALLLPFGEHRPEVAHSAWLAPNATLVGQVSIGENSSVFYGAVARGDMDFITIGAGSNLQDNVVVHTDTGVPTVIGDGVSVGHAAVLHGCTVENDCLIGALLCNETRAMDWLMDLIANGGSTQELRKWLFAPCAAPPTSSPARGRIVCNCFDVAESEIVADFASGLDLDAVQAKRKCGTSCGSCRTELHRLQGQGASKTKGDPTGKTETCRV